MAQRFRESHHRTHDSRDRQKVLVDLAVTSTKEQRFVEILGPLRMVGLSQEHGAADSLIHGPRQCGKTTLARSVGEKLGYAYVTFDDR